MIADAALTSLGRSMSLDAVSIDGGGLQDTVAGQTLAHPFTADVSVLSYRNVNSISGVPASAGVNGPMFLAKDMTSVWGAAESLVGGGEILLAADANLLSELEDEVANDNHVFFLNVAPPPMIVVSMLGRWSGLWILIGLIGATGIALAPRRGPALTRERIGAS